MKSPVIELHGRGVSREADCLPIRGEVLPSKVDGHLTSGVAVAPFQTEVESSLVWFLTRSLPESRAR